MKDTDRVYIAGHKGMVGSAIVRLLEKRGFGNLLLRTSKELDLRNTSQVEKFFEEEKPNIVIMAAARVGGIQANIEKPAEFLFENLMIQNNVTHQAYLNKVKKFCFLGSSCIYPKESIQPIKEEYLLTGPLEPTNEGYAISKIAGLKMVENYYRQYDFPGISLMPCNLYGTNDSFDPLHSHVLSALVKKFVDAVDSEDAQVTVWGSGKARREFMHVDDMAEAVLFLMADYNSPQILNIGPGKDISIYELSNTIAAKSNYYGKILWDTSKPDGMLRKCLDVSKMKSLGFFPKVSLEEGIERTIEQYKTLKRKIINGEIL